MPNIEPGSRMYGLFKSGQRRALAIASEDRPDGLEFIQQKQRELGGEIGYCAWDRSTGGLVRVDEAMFPWTYAKEISKDGPTHELKTWPEPFQAVWEGRKTHEVRVNDRPGGFTTEDLLILREFVPPESPFKIGVLTPMEAFTEPPKEGTYTGRTLFAVPTYITPGGRFGLPENMVVMSIRVIAKNQNWKP